MIQVGVDAESAAYVDELVAGCRAGDAHAWRRFYECHFDHVYRTARRLGSSPTEASDVVHDTFIVAIRKLDQFQGGSLRAWLYRICANLVSDRHRKRRVRRAFAALKVWIGGEPGESPERAAVRTSDETAVRRILEAMSSSKREVLALFELEGLSGEEIASRLGCPTATVWTRLHYARQEFRQAAKRLGYDPRGEGP